MNLNDAVKSQTVNIVHPETGAWTQQFHQFDQLRSGLHPQTLVLHLLAVWKCCCTDPADMAAVLEQTGWIQSQSSWRPSIPAAVWWDRQVCHVACPIHREKNPFSRNPLWAFAAPPAAWPCSYRRELREEGWNFLTGCLKGQAESWHEEGRSFCTCQVIRDGTRVRLLSDSLQSRPGKKLNSEIWKKGFCSISSLPSLLFFQGTQWQLAGSDFILWDLFQTKVHSSGWDLKENYSTYKKYLTLLLFR